MTIQIPIRLDMPHAKQAAFINSPAKRKVICTGRRAGKTTGSAILAADKFLNGRRILDAAPTQDQTEMFWDGCKRYLQPGIDKGVIYKNETRRVMEMQNGARIKAKTAWDADSLRGDYADLLILEEFSLMDAGVWDEVGAPMLLDNDGDAIFIFTPKRRNHAWKMFQRAKADTSGRWGYWHFTSMDNPYLSEAALAEITSDMTDESYRQEILAEFLEDEGAVFRNIAACMNAPPRPRRTKHQGHRIVMGCDWGKQDDFTVLSVVCADCRQELVLDRFNKIDYHFQRERLKALADKWNVAEILAESNAMGEPVIDELQHEDVPVVGFATTSTSKPPLIESLSLALERVETQWQDNPTATAELEAFERTVSPTTGRSSYSAPAGMHDDTVIARALANWAANQVPAKLRVNSVNPFYS